MELMINLAMMCYLNIPLYLEYILEYFIFTLFLSILLYIKWWGPSENTNKYIIKTQNSFDDGSTIGVGECSAWGYENKAEECIKEAIKSLTDNKLLEYEQHMNDALELYGKCSSAWRGIYENKCKGYNIELSNIPVDDDINTLRNNGHAGRSCNECKYDVSVSYALSSIAEALNVV